MKLHNKPKFDPMLEHPAFEKTAFRHYLIDNFLDRLFSECCVCGFDRCKVDFAHKTSAKEGGKYQIGNIYPLCPNHHRLFDRKNLDDFEVLKLANFDKAIQDKLRRQFKIA